MPQLVIELPSREEQLAFNRRRWEEVLHDPEFRDTRHRIETNAFGKVIMSPPAALDHSDRVLRIQLKLHALLGGKPFPECPISTMGGVRAADVGWFSDERLQSAKGTIAYETAPDICIEVLSPDNTDAEMTEKRRLYFDAGAGEFWLCDLEGRMTFFCTDDPDREREQSKVCAAFPREI